MKRINRREFVKTMVAGGVLVGLGKFTGCSRRDVVSVVKIKNGNTDEAVRAAIDMLGGIRAITRGKKKIMLKPNLVSPAESDTTKPAVIKALAQLMLEASKEVFIGEGSAGSVYNFNSNGVCRIMDIDTLILHQQSVFDALGYTDLASSLNVPLVNLHVGEMVSVPLRRGFVYDNISLHRSLMDIDMLCSVPMMKTHTFDYVTLGMKNLIGLYPGQVYGTVRSAVHEKAAQVEKTGTASAVVDIVRANKLGLVVIDASVAMEGQGPNLMTGGRLVQMDLIIAGANALAMDMVAAYIMGFEPNEVSTFEWAWRAGMRPTQLSAIEVRGTQPDIVRKPFLRPTLIPYANLNGLWGPPC